MDSMYIKAETSAVSAHRIRELVELPREVHIPESGALDAAAAEGFTVALRDLSFAYQEGTDVIRRSALLARPGEIVALIGPSGEGKTTLIRLILGLIHPQAGEAVREIHVTGSHLYTEEQVAAASGISIGDNLISIKKANAASLIMTSRRLWWPGMGL